MKVEGWGTLRRSEIGRRYCFLRCYQDKDFAEESLDGDYNELVRVTLEIPDSPHVTGEVTKEE